MRRIRTIKPEFFEHEELFDAEQSSQLPLRLAFIGLLTCCDREGRFCWRPRRLKLGILPYDDIDFNAILEALAQYQFIMKYTINNKTYGYIPSFKKHQCINNRESFSDIPPPPSTIDQVTQSAEIVTSTETSSVTIVESTPALELRAILPDVKKKVVGTTYPGYPIALSAQPNIEQVFTHWQQVMNEPDAQLDHERQTLIKRALKLGYSVAQLCDAITGCRHTPYNWGDNPRAEKFVSLRIIFKDADQIDRFRHNCHQPPVLLTPQERQQRQCLANVNAWVKQKMQEGGVNHASQ
jgi:hypothetical protein